MKDRLNKFKKLFSKDSRRSDVKCFSEEQEKEKAFDYVDQGIKMIPLDQIVGSVGRYNDFDSSFRLKDHMPHERLDGIKKLMQEGKNLPPVDLYKIKNKYYVLDGNHRISAAKEFGYQDIRARIVEFIPSRDNLEHVLYRERARFYKETGLPFSIELTEIGQYEYLMKQITEHKTHLESQSEALIPLKDAAEDWFKTIYWPLASMIKKGNLSSSFPGRTLADLYVFISYHQWEKERPRSYGIGISRYISNSMEEFRNKMSDKKGVDYPEMLREVTAFVLMNVEARKEHRAIEKIFALDEVKELHSVHGSVDILAKIVLTRDLLSSDAEVIGFFVHNKIRQIPGVISTQTLIPGFSKIKE